MGRQTLCAGDGGVWFVLKALRQVIRMLEDHGYNVIQPKEKISSGIADSQVK